MEREQITINGMKFRAERLMPNYRGEYDCICENCIFSANWVDFGKDSPCMKVKCMINDGRNGNRNVWVAAGEPSATIRWYCEMNINEQKP